MNRKPFILLKLNKITAEILVYGAIASWGENNAKVFKKELIKAKNEGYENLNIRINSVGGEVFEGLAMIQALKETELNVSIYIDGLAASMASVFVTVPNAKIYMAKNARLMIHQAKMWSEGQSEDMRRNADLLDSINLQIAEAYAGRVGQEKDWVLQNWMQHGQDMWFTAEESQENNLIDEVIDGVVSENKEQNLTRIAAFFEQELDKPKSKKNNTNTMKIELSIEAAKSLGLSSQESTTEAINAKVLALSLAKANAEKELNDLKNEQEQAKLEAITNKVRAGIKSGKFKADKESSLIKLGLQDEALLDETLELTKGKTNLSSQTVSSGIKNVETREDFQKLSESEKLAFKNEHTEQYMKLFA